MKPKDYVKQFGLNPDGPVHRDIFCFCLRDDFLEAVEASHGHQNIAGYEQAIRVIRMKFDAIGVRIGRTIEERCWEYLYSIHIAPLREQLFPEELRFRREEKRRKRKAKEEREKEKRLWADMINNWGIGRDKYYQDFINQIFNTPNVFRNFGKATTNASFEHMFGQGMGGGFGNRRRAEPRRPTPKKRRSIITVDEAFRILGIEECSSLIIVKKTYRALCKKVHPDTGGSAEEFIRINEAYTLICKHLEG